MGWYRWTALPFVRAGLGPYTIGFLEWDEEQWQDQPEPAFGASEDWENGGVYEPNLVYHDGKWKM